MSLDAKAKERSNMLLEIDDPKKTAMQMACFEREGRQ